MTLIGNNVINIFDKWWLFINMAGRNFKNSPPLSTFSLKQDYNGSFGKNTFGKGNFSRQMASKCSLVLHFYSCGLYTNWNTSL